MTTAALAALGAGAALAWLAAGLRELHPAIAGVLGVVATWLLLLGAVALGLEVHALHLLAERQVVGAGGPCLPGGLP